MSRAAARFKRSFQTSTPDRDARLRLAGESSLDRGAPGTNSSAPLSVHAPMFHQHHVLKTFAKDHIPDPAGILDVTSPKPASRPPKRDRLPVSSSDTKQVLPKHPHLPTPKSNQWIESPNTVTALSLHSTPVAKPPRQFHKPKSTSPVIHFGEFSIKQTPPTPTTVPKEIPKTTPVTTLSGIPKSTPRFSLPPRRNRLTKSPVAKTDQVQSSPAPSPTPVAIIVPKPTPRFSLPLRHFKPIIGDQATQTQSEYTHSSSNPSKQATVQSDQVPSLPTVNTVQDTDTSSMEEQMPRSVDEEFPPSSQSVSINDYLHLIWSEILNELGIDPGLFVPKSAPFATTQLIVDVSDKSSTPTALTALPLNSSSNNNSLNSSSSINSLVSNDANDDDKNNGDVSQPSAAPSANPPVPPPPPEPS